MKARVGKAIYENSENGFCVVSFWTKDGSIPDEAQTYQSGGRTYFTGVGYGLPTRENVDVELEGDWETSKYGKLQYSVSGCQELLPKTREGIVSYLSSGSIKGIGPKLAEAIVQQFGMNTLDVLDRDPQMLLQVPGIQEAKLQGIVNSYRENSAMREVATFLSPFGISPNKIAKICKQFGGKAVEVLQKEPYRLCGISGFAFKIVDTIAQSIRCDPGDPLRVRGAIQYTLEADQKLTGSLYMDKMDLLNRAMSLLTENVDGVSEEWVRGTINTMVKTGYLIYEEGRIFLPRAYAEEYAIAAVVVSMVKASDRPPIQPQIIQEAQQTLGIQLAPAQEAGAEMALMNHISILTGGPGTGKTTTLRVIIEAYKKAIGGDILLVAPTGRASRRMAESCGQEAQTIHSALNISSETDDNYVMEPLTADFVIVDEASMLDVHIAERLFNRLKKGSQILLVGDQDQLPPVGPGCVFRDLIACEAVPVVHLEAIYRQEEGSRIAQNARRIMAGENNLVYGPDFQFIEANNPEETAEKIYKLYLQEVKEFGMDEVQILSPYRKKGAASVNTMNPVLRDRMNPERRSSQQVKYGNRVFREGDKVLQVRNQDGISNGDVGRVTRIYTEETKGEIVTVEFSGERTVDYGREELDLLDWAYAMSIHKAQGSEYSIVIVPVLYSFYMLLKRDIYYTAITRAKRKVILVGQKKAFQKAIGKEPAPRNTTLSQRVRRRIA